MRLTDTPIINHPSLIWTLKDYDAAIEEAVIRCERADNENEWKIAYEVRERLTGEIFTDFDTHRVLHDIHLRAITKKTFTSAKK